MSVLLMGILTTLLSSLFHFTHTASKTVSKDTPQFSGSARCFRRFKTPHREILDISTLPLPPYHSLLIYSSVSLLINTMSSNYPSCNQIFDSATNLDSAAKDITRYGGCWCVIFVCENIPGLLGDPQLPLSVTGYNTRQRFQSDTLFYCTAKALNRAAC